MLRKKVYPKSAKVISVEDQDGLEIALIDPEGRERLDDTVIAPPIGYRRQPSMVEIIRAQVQSELLARYAAEQGMETFEEADDFDVDDDLDPSTPYENDFDPPMREVREEVERSRKRGTGVEPLSGAPKEPTQGAPEGGSQ